jgi:hypothetical protein
VSEARADVMGLSNYVYQRTRSRLAGLTDDEYFWEPVPGCCTIRRTDSDAYRADSADRPVAVLRPATGVGDPPFATIAWRLWHLIGCYGGKRNPQWLGVERPAGGFESWRPAPSVSPPGAVARSSSWSAGSRCTQAGPGVAGGGRSGMKRASGSKPRLPLRRSWPPIWRRSGPGWKPTRRTLCRLRWPAAGRARRERAPE